MKADTLLELVRGLEHDPDRWVLLVNAVKLLPEIRFDSPLTIHGCRAEDIECEVHDFKHVTSGFKCRKCGKHLSHQTG